jgi:predicted nucleic acid-binding protein
LIFYLDASVLVSLLVTDANSAAAGRFAASAPEVHTSHWAVAEASSAFALELRVGQMDQAERQAADARLDTWAASRGDTITPIEADFIAARTLLRVCRTALRAPDALHLAISRRSGSVLATFDQRLFDAATEVGAAPRLLSQP